MSPESARPADVSPIVAEVRRVRDAVWEACGSDLNRLIAELREIERQQVAQGRPAAAPPAPTVRTAG